LLAVPTEQPFDLGLRQVFASAQVGIWGSHRPQELNQFDVVEGD
jgi:hypothetical protein